MISKFLILTSRGLENLLLDELKALLPEASLKLKGTNIEADLTQEQMYQVCLYSRLAGRVLMSLAEGQVDSADALYKLASSINWSTHLNAHGSLAVDFNGTNGEIRNTQFGAVKVKDAIVDQFAELFESRPNVEKEHPDIRVNVRLKGKFATIYLDVVGGNLHTRGYRQFTGEAPLKEHLAFGLLVRSGWTQNPEKALVDPMCGSGTIVVEAAMFRANIAPGLVRGFWGFERWKQHQPKVWLAMKSKAQTKAEKGKESAKALAPLHGYDANQQVVAKANKNALLAEVDELVEFSVESIEELKHTNSDTGFVVTNPPYGERLGNETQMIYLYQKLGSLFASQFLGWNLGLITSKSHLTKYLRQGKIKQYKLKNGPLDCVFNTYVIEAAKSESVSTSNSPFANRLKKNLKQLKSWIHQNELDAYRVYDADIPEYNVAVDIYRDQVVVHEYQAPKNIPEAVSQKRFAEALAVIPEVLSISIQNVHSKTRSRQKGKDQYAKLDSKSRPMTIKEYGAKFYVNLTDYLDTGVFIDHRKTRQLVAQMAKGKSFLNLFAYTGTVSVQAALHGAKSVHTVDMSKTYVSWAQDNFKLNGLKGVKYQFEQSDCLTWLDSNEQQFELIFVDPPTFSNSKRMNTTFDVQRDHIELLKKVAKHLTEDGQIVFTNNKRLFKMEEQELQQIGLKCENWTEKTRDKDFARNKHIHNSWLITRL